VDKLKPLLDLKKKIENANTELAKAEGKIEQEMEGLEKFNCSTLDDAKKLLIKLEGRREKMHKKLKKEAQIFAEKWPEI
jgi:hypothetical protein